MECNTGVFFERATAACSCSFVMPWLSWKIGDSSKKAVWKIGIVETAALRWALRRTSTFLEFNMVPGYVRRRKGRGKGEEEGDSIVSPLLPSLTSPFFSPFSQASRTSPFFVSFPWRTALFRFSGPQWCKTGILVAFFTVLFERDTCPITFSFFPDVFPLFTVHAAKPVSYSTFCNTITERRRQQTQLFTSR